MKIHANFFVVDFLIFSFQNFITFDFHKIIYTEKFKNEKNKGLSETRLIFLENRELNLKVYSFC